MATKICRAASAVIILLAIAPIAAFACGGVGFSTPEELVARAEFIVRARAERLVTNQQPFQSITSHVEFDVIAPFKGTLSNKTLSLAGMFENRDDPNDRAVPYDAVRPGGRHGNCFAVTYRQGAEYLLFLRRNTVADGRGELSPYWASLAPTNEQISGDSDPWVRWVTDHVRHPSLAPRIGEADRSAYAGIQDAQKWRNPRITIRPDGIQVESDPPSRAYLGVHETVSSSELADALVALPPAEWPYGRVVLIADSHLRRGDGSDDESIKRNHEAAVEVLKMLKIDPHWWP
jgi:hypothetical protein